MVIAEAKRAAINLQEAAEQGRSYAEQLLHASRDRLFMIDLIGGRYWD